MKPGTHAPLILAGVFAALALAWNSAQGDVVTVVAALAASAVVVSRTGVSQIFGLRQPAAPAQSNPGEEPAQIGALKTADAKVQQAMRVTIPHSSIAQARVRAAQDLLDSVEKHEQRGAQVSPFVLAILREDLRHQRAMLRIALAIEQDKRSR
jgi:hypothetical protein